MKVKFKYGIKSFSGTHDEMVFANYENFGVVIGRMMPEKRELTENQILMGNRLGKISSLWNLVSSGYKEDMIAYAVKFSLLPERTGTVGVNAFSIFVKAIYAASKSETNPLHIDSINADDLEMGSYDMIDNVVDMVDAGFLPVVSGYELLTTSIIPL